MWSHPPFSHRTMKNINELIQQIEVAIQERAKVAQTILAAEKAALAAMPYSFQNLPVNQALVWLRKEKAITQEIARLGSAYDAALKTIDAPDQKVKDIAKKLDAAVLEEEAAFRKRLLARREKIMADVFKKVRPLCVDDEEANDFAANRPEAARLWDVSQNWRRGLLDVLAVAKKLVETIQAEEAEKAPAAN